MTYGTRSEAYKAAESMAIEHATDKGRYFYDLIDSDVDEITVDGELEGYGLSWVKYAYSDGRNYRTQKITA